MELRHLRYFVAVANELHFGRAAERLHISQPPLSQQIQDLERELGVELFHRTRHFVALTEAGRVFLEEALRTLRDADNAVETARKAARGDCGRLSIGFGPAPEAGILRRVLALFLSHHPKVVLELHHLYTREQIEALVDRRIDVAFPLLPVAHRDIATEVVTTEPLIAALPTEHPLARAPRISLRDLRSDPFVRLRPDLGPGFDTLVARACGDAGFERSVVHEASHVLTVLGFVGAGLGVAILPGALRGRPAEGVVFRSLERAPTVEIGVAYRHQEPSALLHEFLGVVREVSRPKRPRTLQGTATA
jgi:DNA-binding transcriptional LysR family regulator